MPSTSRTGRYKAFPVIGTSFIDVLDLFQNDPDTDAIVMIGEIGGDDEERAAEFIRANVTKPMAGFIAGRTAPEGKRMGHAGAIISGGGGTAESKISALESAGVRVADSPSHMEIADHRLLPSDRPMRPQSACSSARGA